MKNLYVTDGAAFVSNADKNPTLSILALAWRASRPPDGRDEAEEHLMAADRIDPAAGHRPASRRRCRRGWRRRPPAAGQVAAQAAAQPAAQGAGAVPTGPARARREGWPKGIKDPLDPDLVNPELLWAKLLTAEERATAAAVCDVIIPADERSPAASAVGVHDFVDEWVSAPYPRQKEDRQIVRGGLAWINTEAHKRFGTPLRRAGGRAEDGDLRRHRRRRDGQAAVTRRGRGSSIGCGS